MIADKLRYPSRKVGSAISPYYGQSSRRKRIMAMWTVRRQRRVIGVTIDNPSLLKLMQDLPPDGFPGILGVPLIVSGFHKAQQVVNPPGLLSRRTPRIIHT